MDSNNEQNLRDFASQIINKISKMSYADLLPKINQVVQSSISDNFQSEGRYGNENIFGGGSRKWERSKRAVRKSGQTLSDKGQLAASIRVKSHSHTGKIRIEIGSNKPYAAHHHFGSRTGGFKHPGGTSYVIRKVKGVTKAKFVSNKYAAAHPEKIKGITKPHQITLPARPFLVLQNQDLFDIARLILKHIKKNF